MQPHVRLYFAGLARNCAPNVAANINALMRIIDANCDCVGSIFVLENDSKDNTGAILAELQALYPARVRLWRFPGLAAAHSERISRLAWCRNFLLEQIRVEASNGSKNTFYAPIDLDGEIATSLRPEMFWQAIKALDSSPFHGFFPLSSPFYYDLLALRKPGWVEADHRELVAAARPRLGWYRALERHVFSHQLPMQAFAGESVIPVRSAFGGLGLYHFIAIRDARYTTKWLGHCFECEHVSFNRQIGALAIYCELIIQAPSDHIEFQLMAGWQRHLFRLTCWLKDRFNQASMLLQKVFNLTS